MRERAEQIHGLARATAAGIVQIGQRLTEVKERLGHGRFLKWIEREFAWSDWNAKAFMRVYRCFKSENFSDLQIDVSALYLIAKTSTPEPVRTEAIRRAETGEKVTHATVKAVVAAYEEPAMLQPPSASYSTSVRAAQRQDAEERKALPSPAEARRTAVATGAHTLDRNGTCQPPMTVDQQEAWRGDWRRVSPVADFIRWVVESAETDLPKIVKMIEARHWRKRLCALPAGSSVAR